MQTKTIVQASADIVRIQRLRPNDVYKRLIPRTYGEGDRLVFGVVTSVSHNGEQAMITAVEYAVAELGSDLATVVTFGGDRDIAIFPAEAEEVAVHFAALAEAARKAVADAQRTLDRAKEREAEVRRGRRNARHLTSPETTGEPLPAIEAEVTEEVPF